MVYVILLQENANVISYIIPLKIVVLKLNPFVQIIVMDKVYAKMIILVYSTKDMLEIIADCLNVLKIVMEKENVN